MKNLLFKLGLVLAALLATLSSCGREQPNNNNNATPLQRGPELSLLDSGYTMVTLQETYLKRSTDDSSQLPPGELCFIKSGASFALDGLPSVTNYHWRVNIKGNPPGCSFSSGYIYENRMYVPELSRPRYIVPMPGSQVSSSWCRCRDIGSSPHIGLDLAKSGGMRSYAVADGYVQSVYLKGGCGWEVKFRDNGGSIWRYLHLNKPVVEAGTNVKKGAYFGEHSAYPSADCGSGAHLHLERLSAGTFGDKSVGKTCQNGYKTCNYDPASAFNQLGLTTFTDLQENSWSFEPIPAEPRTVSATARDLLCQPDQAQPVSTDLQLDRLFEKQVLDSPDVPRGEAPSLRAKFNTRKVGADLAVLSWDLQLSKNGKDNPKNLCPSDGGCIVRWELYVEGLDGTVKRMLTDQAAAGSPLTLTEDSLFCLGFKTTGRYGIVARLGNGQTLTQLGNLVTIPGERKPKAPPAPMQDQKPL